MNHAAQSVMRRLGCECGTDRAGGADLRHDQPVRRLACLVFALAAVSCAEHLPDQDLRILTAQPAAKLSSTDLWRDFDADAVSARRTYFGRALDVSGAPSFLEAEPPAGPHLFFVEAGERGIRARLLEDRAADVLAAAKVGERLTLRCFCEGLNEQGDVLLKSCIGVGTSGTAGASGATGTSGTAGG